jgi:hypothetical protein
MKPGKKVNSGKKGTSGSSLQDTTAVQACVYCHLKGMRHDFTTLLKFIV